MDILLLLSIMVCQFFNNIALKNYGKKVSDGAISFTASAIFFQIVFFICAAGGKLDFSNPAILPYAIIFGISFGTATLFNTFAVQSGPLSLTVLFVNFSLLFPTVYGIIFYNEPLNFLFISGLFLLLMCIVFVNIKPKGVVEKKANYKWIIFVILSLVGNGGCTISQTAQQRAFLGTHKSELMVIALSIAFVATFITGVVSKKKRFFTNIKTGFGYQLLYALCNGTVNLLVMTLTGRNVLPVSVIFPTISGGGIVLASLLSIFIYKEKLNRNQLIGVVIGIAAIVLLNL